MEDQIISRSERAPATYRESLADADVAQLEKENHIFLAIGPNVWGRGFTHDQALRAAGNPREYVILACRDPWSHIDGMGDIVYTPNPDGKPMYWKVAEKHPKTRKR